MSWLTSVGRRVASRLKILAALCLLVVIAYLGLPFGTQSLDDPDAVTTLPSGQPDPKNPQLLMFLDVEEQTDLTGAVDLELNIEALQRGEALWLPVGPDGQLVELSDYESAQGRYSTSFRGTLTIAGVDQPITITTSRDAIFATIPTALGVLEGYGSTNKINFRFRYETTDRIDERTDEPLVLYETPEWEIKCLNC